MPAFLLRLLWLLRGKQRVRLHLAEPHPSIEGVLVGCWNGHYVLLLPDLLTAPDQTTRLAGHVEVPREKVVFKQVLA